MTDAEILRSVLAGQISAYERAAFDRMLRTLPKWGALTFGQRAWAQQVAHRLGVAVDAVALPSKAKSAWDPSARRGCSSAGPARPQRAP